MSLRTCAKCKIAKEFFLFSKKKESPTGLKAYCKECDKLYFKINQNKIAANQKERILNDVEKHKEYQKQYYIKNAERLSDKSRKRKALIPVDIIRDYQRKYKFSRRRLDVNFRISLSLRSRFCIAIKNNEKTGSAIRDLGCSIQELKQRLESKFQEGMTWDNYGRAGWHIDHIIALSRFDLSNREELLKACHYSNLQPLWAKDNMRKGCKMNYALVCP
mgnify:CR=1 FL=1